MTIELQRGKYLRPNSGAGNTVTARTGTLIQLKGSNMKRLILALSLGLVALSGCAQLKEFAASGATAAEEQSPYPTRFKNDHFYPL